MTLHAISAFLPLTPSVPSSSIASPGVGVDPDGTVAAPAASDVREAAALAVGAARGSRDGVRIGMLPLESGHRLLTIAASRDAHGDGALLLALADAVLNHGVLSVGIPVRHLPCPDTDPSRRELAERLLAGGGMGVARSVARGQVTVTTLPVRYPRDARPGQVDVVVEAESGARCVSRLALHALPLRQPALLVDRAAQALASGDPDATLDRGAGQAVPGLVLIHDRGMIDRLPSVAAISNLCAGRSPRVATVAVEASIARVDPHVRRARARAIRAAAGTRPLPPPPPPPPSPVATPRVHGDCSTMGVAPSPVLRCPREAMPPTPSEPTRDLWTELDMLTKGDVAGLSRRMGRPGGLRGWWRKHFGPKVGLGNEVLGHARLIGKRMASAYLGVDGKDRAFMPAQMELLVYQSVRRSFQDCAYGARKEWARRVAGAGVGDFRRARQALDREAGPLPMTLGRPGDRPDVRQLEAQFARAVIRALVGATRQS